MTNLVQMTNAAVQTYQAVALHLMMSRADHLARSSPFPECPPIASSNLVSEHVSLQKFGFGGYIATSNYGFGFFDGQLQNSSRRDFIPKTGELLPFYHELARKKSLIGTNETLAIAIQTVRAAGVDLEAVESREKPRTEQRWVVARPMRDDEEITDLTPRLTLPLFEVKWGDLIDVEILGTSKGVTRLQIGMGVPRLAPMLEVTNLSHTGQELQRRRSRSSANHMAGVALHKTGTDAGPPANYTQEEVNNRRARAMPNLMAKICWAITTLDLDEDCPKSTNDLTKISFSNAYGGLGVGVATKKHYFGFNNGLLTMVQDLNPTPNEQELHAYYSKLSEETAKIDGQEALQISRHVLSKFKVSLSSLEKASPPTVSQTEVLDRFMGEGTIIPPGLKKRKVPIFTIQWGSLAEVEVSATTKKVRYISIHPWLVGIAPVVIGSVEVPSAPR